METLKLLYSQSLMFLVLVSLFGCDRPDQSKAKSPSVQASVKMYMPLPINLHGIYATSREIAGFSGTILEISDAKFRYWFYSDVRWSGEPEYPISGKALFQNERVVIEFHPEREEVWFPDEINGVQVLLRDDALEAWKKESKIYDYGILIKTDYKRVDENAKFERPSITVLFDEEMNKRLKNRIDPFITGPQ